LYLNLSYGKEIQKKENAMKTKSVILMILAFAIVGCSTVKANNLPVSVLLPTITPATNAIPTVTLVPDISTTETPIAEIPTVTSTPDDLIHFGPAVDYPSSLDEMWDFIDEGRSGWTFSPCGEGELTKPYVTWEMAKLAVFFQAPERRHPRLIIQAIDTARILASGGGVFPDTGTITIEEDLVYIKLIELVIRGNIMICSTNNEGKPTLYGPGVQEFLNWLGSYIVK
jgi:hypothetical protein